MSEPLIKLQQGKALGAFDGVVETWNYVVDFVQNLVGDGELDENGAARVDRTDEKRPVIRIDKSKIGGGGGGGGGRNIRIVGTDGTAAVVGDPSSLDYKSVSFASAADANVSVHVEGDGEGNATVTLGVYYK